MYIGMWGPLPKSAINLLLSHIYEVAMNSPRNSLGGADLEPLWHWQGCDSSTVGEKFFLIFFCPLCRPQATMDNLVFPLLPDRFRIKYPKYPFSG